MVSYYAYSTACFSILILEALVHSSCYLTLHCVTEQHNCVTTIYSFLCLETLKLLLIFNYAHSGTDKYSSRDSPAQRATALLGGRICSFSNAANLLPKACSPKLTPRSISRDLCFQIFTETWWCRVFKCLLL